MTPIEEKFAELQAQGEELGVMMTFEVPLFDGGAVQDFDLGSIYFHPTVGAFLCRGEILQKYRELGEIQSGLGYPVSDEGDDPFVLLGRKQEFEFGTLLFPPGDTVSVRFNERVRIPQVVVKLFDEVPVSLAQGETVSLDDLAAQAGLAGASFLIDSIRALLPDLRFRRSFNSLPSSEIAELVSQAMFEDPAYTPPNFDNFLEIDCPAGFDMSALVSLLRLWTGVVEHVYPALALSNPGVGGVSNPKFLQQGYLDFGPRGISAQAAWIRGADGTGTRLIDIERGWRTDHEDFPQGIQLLEGRSEPESIGHGTAVLGQIVAQDNNIGVVGIAPETQVSLLSLIELNPTDLHQQRERLADMILKAIPLLSDGDVILLEAQLSEPGNPDRKFPVECDLRVFKTIELATRLRLIVVEAGANGNLDLDQYEEEGRRVLQRGSPDFRNSGAILVGASQSGFPTLLGHPRDARSNFGSRIDCYAWGENITTTGTKTPPVLTNSYMSDMSGTSGASAIIAGVCLLVQNLQSLLTPLSGVAGPLRAEVMQRMLSNPANGTTSPDKIGVMPNFQKILANEYQ